MSNRCLCAVKPQLSCISFLSHLSYKMGKVLPHLPVLAYVLRETKDCKFQCKWSCIGTLRDRQKDEYHPQGANAPAIPVAATETSAIYSLAYTITIESY